MFNNLKCPKFNFFISDFPKLRKDDQFFCYIAAPLLFDQLGGNFTWLEARAFVGKRPVKRDMVGTIKNV